MLNNVLILYRKRICIQNEEVIIHSYASSLCRMTLQDYIESSILPMYDSFDAGHGQDHVRSVIAESLRMAQFYDVKSDMVYAAAAYHDTGLTAGRETHHLESGRIIRADVNLKRWFTPGEIETVAQAAEDHRASSDHEPRSIYGRIVAEADRQIVPDLVIKRSVQYGKAHFPGHDREWHWNRVVEHMHEKYDYGGYLKLWIPQSENARSLAALREIIHDEARLRALFDKYYL